LNGANVREDVGQRVEVEVLQVNRYGRGELESDAPSNQVVVSAHPLLESLNGTTIITSVLLGMLSNKDLLMSMSENAKLRSRSLCGGILPGI
jgi:hypothetical protein